jgi:pimeloyl-ACP methyl ester carboxylesterase
MSMILMLACAGSDQTFFVRNDGADMRIQVSGPAEPDTLILLVHGGPGGNGHEYSLGPYAEQLEAEVAMVWWDQRGQGASTGRYDSADVTVGQLADDGAAVVDFLRNHYGDDVDIYLMGHSWGGTLGTAMLLETDVQDELAGWIESDGAHDIPRLNQHAVGMFIEVGQAELDQGNNTAFWTETVEWAQGLDPDNLSVADGGEINQIGGKAESMVGAVQYGGGGGSLWEATLGSPIPWHGALSGTVTANLLFDEVEAAAYTDRLHEIQIPTLLLWGRYDFICPPGLAYDALERIPDSELVMFEHSGHSPMDGEAEAYSQAILEFVR